MKKIAGLTALALTAALSAGGAYAAGDAPGAEGGPAKIKVGMLTCDLTGNSNMIVLSKSEYACKLEAADKSYSANYVAKIDKVGLDLSATQNETIKWAVASSMDKFQPDVMNGVYVGAAADASLGYGGGVRVLVGGKQDTISLQPISVTGKKGFGVALGLERMELKRVAE